MEARFHVALPWNGMIVLSNGSFIMVYSVIFFKKKVFSGTKRIITLKFGMGPLVREKSGKFYFSSQRILQIGNFEYCSTKVNEKSHNLII